MYKRKILLLLNKIKAKNILSDGFSFMQLKNHWLSMKKQEKSFIFLVLLHFL